MLQLSKTELFHLSKAQSYDALDETAVLTIFPRLYLTTENPDDFISKRLKDSNSLIQAVDLLNLADELAFIDFSKVWNEALSSLSKRQNDQTVRRPRVYTYDDFEAQNSTELKLKVVIQQILHVIEEPFSELCNVYYCCSLLESPSMLDSMTLITSVVAAEVFEANILPKLVVNLCIHCGPKSRHLIERLVMNFPHLWPDIYEHFLNQISYFKSKAETRKSALCLATLQYLVSFVPETSNVMDECIRLKILPDLVMRLAITNSNKDENFSILQFFTQILINQTPDVQSWFAGYLKSAWNSNPTFTNEINENLFSAISIFELDPNSNLPDKLFFPAMEFLQTIAALCGYTDFALSAKLRSATRKLIMRNTGKSEKAVHYICFCLSFMVGFRHSLVEVSPGIADMSSEEQLISWLQSLISRQDMFHSGDSDASSYSEVLLLFGLLFSTNQHSAIRQIIVNTIGIDAPCILRNVSTSRKFFTHRVFTNQFITTQAANVPVTVRLNANMKSNLPIHCVNELLTTHAFNKNRVHIKGWVYRQICECVRPLHGLMLELLESYATNALNQANAPSTASGMVKSSSSGSGGCVLFSEEEILVQFSAPVFSPLARSCAPGATEFQTELSDGDEVDLTPQLLFLYYMLFIYDQELMNKFRDDAKNQRTPRASLTRFSDKLWDAIPITYLLQYARANVNSYREFYPRLLQLVTNYRPFLVIRETIVQDELLLGSLQLHSTVTSMQLFKDSYFSRLVTSSPTRPLTPKELLSTMERILIPNTSPKGLQCAIGECIVGVNELSRWANNRTGFERLHCLLPYTEVIGCALPRTFLECDALSGNRRFVNTACALWRSLHCIIPIRLEVLTVRALRPKKDSSISFTHRDLLKDPVENIITAIDRRVYRSPPLMTLLIRILECRLQACRYHWESRVVGRSFLLPASKMQFAGKVEKQHQQKGSNGRPTLEPISMDQSGAAVPPLPVAQQSHLQNPSEILATDEQCNRYYTTLIHAHEASVVHLLMEMCLPTKEEKNLNSDVTNLREVENSVCFLIQNLLTFDNTLAGAIFAQTYPRSLNALMTRGVPACKLLLDYGQDTLIKSGNIESVIFYLDFLSHFGLHHSNEIVCDCVCQAIDVVNYIFTSVLCVDDLPSVLLACGPAFCRLSCAFPNLGHCIVHILLHVMATLADALAISGDSRLYDELVRRISALTPDATETENAIFEDFEQLDDGLKILPKLRDLTRLEKYYMASLNAMRWFNRVVQFSSLQGRIYIPPGLEHLPRLYKSQY
nr:integrator complex subunit 2 [Hymenolepis microstoma]